MPTRDLLAQEKSAYPRVEPPCPYFGPCGGCTLQDLAYPDQVLLKRKRLQQAFDALEGMPPIDLVPLEDPWRYRNKAELTFGQVNGRLLLGYHAAGSFWRIVDLDDCLLLPSAVTHILRDMREFAAQTNLPAYQPRTHQGFFRYLLVRSSRATGRILLCLMTTRGSRAVIEPLADALIARHPAVVSFYWGITNTLADVAVPDELVHVAGERWLEDRMGPWTLKLHPLSFLQPTTAQAERMYQALCEAFQDRALGTAWDLYCGVGVVGLYLSRLVTQVYGIDVEPHHLELARLNATANGVTNVDVRVGRVEELLMDRRFWLQAAKPDLVVVDPPRIGLHPRALSSVVAARPRFLAYISCNIQSLVRDLRAFGAGFPRYRVTTLKAFDMFPQTTHVETLALLERV